LSRARPGPQEKTWNNSYADGIEGSRFLINTDIGLGILPYKMSVPPISVSVEYMFDKAPISIGGYSGVTVYNEDIAYINYKASMVGLGVKGSWHFNFGVNNLDTYVGLVLGLLAYTQNVTTSIPGTPAIPPYVSATPDTTITAEYNLSTLLYGFIVGARYFFTNNLGAYFELGYSAVSIASIGLAVKF